MLAVRTESNGLVGNIHIDAGMSAKTKTRAVRGKNRLEAFSDGVIAIIITIMVLELKVPHGATMDALVPLWPVFISYVLSFISFACRAVLAPMRARH
jgi:hypothetical protein